MTYRILHVLDHSVPLHSGYTFRTLAILREQRRRGWHTEQLTSSKHYGAVDDEEDVDGFHFFRTRTPTGGWRRWPLLDQWSVIHDTRRRLAQVVAQVRPDILHAHSPCLNGIAALSVGRHAGLPVVYEMRAAWEDAAVDHGTTKEGSPRYQLSRALETWTLRRADAVTTICEGLRMDILGRGISPDVVTVIPNAVDPDEFRVIDRPDSQLQGELGLVGRFVLGFIGSFYGYEGLDTLLESLPKIAERQPDARVLLVGGGAEEAKLKIQADRLGIADKVIFTGRVPHADVARYYSLIDVLIYPRKSMKLTETVTPLKPLEAMAQGRLLAASDVGGHRELIADGRTGYFFAPESPDSLADTVRRIAADRTRWPAIKSAGRAFVQSERSWSTSVDRYESVYDSLGGAPRI